MKRLLTSGLAIAAVTLAEALTPDAPTIKMAIPVHDKGTAHGTMAKKKTLSGDIIFNTATGKSVSGTPALQEPTQGLKRAARKANGTNPKKGYVLYENFSGWDGKKSNWIPTGWAVDHRGECSTEYTWSPLEPTQYHPSIADGNYCFCVSFDAKPQDEWLISPAFVPEKNMELSYHMILSPLWYYSTRNLNWITKEYEGGKQTVYTFQVLIKEGDGEWQLLRDYAEEYKEYGYRELVALSNISHLEKQTIGLEDYVGKEVKVAFRYLGADGDLMMLDAIGAGYPTLDDVWYMMPANSLYWGFYNGSDPSMYFQQMTSDIAIYPANAPITWTNMSGEEASYTWNYSDGGGKADVICDDEYELSISYAPDSPTGTPTLYEMPVLKAEAPERVDGEYSSPISVFQAGGKASYKTFANTYDFTLFQFPLIHSDIAFKSVMDDKLGAYSVPVFGYNEFSDDYWLNYSLNGEEPLEGNFSHLLAIGNIFFPSYEAPLVVNGMSIYGWGQIGDDAELTATIYALDSEMHTDPDTYTVVARSTITGKDVVALDDKDSKDYIYLPFKFDEPAIVKASEEHPVFLFMLEGFRSEHVVYFAPLHSYRPDETGYSFGYMLHEINLGGYIERGTYKSLKTLQYSENGTYYDYSGSFAIGLDAEYPLDAAGIDRIVEPISAGSDVEAIYDLSGRKVTSVDSNGVYIVKYTNGDIRKVTVK